MALVADNFKQSGPPGAALRLPPPPPPTPPPDYERITNTSYQYAIAVDDNHSSRKTPHNSYDQGGKTHRDLDEVARAVGADEQRLVHRNRAPQHGAPDHYPHPPDLVNAVDGEVDRRQLRLRDLNASGTRPPRAVAAQIVASGVQNFLKYQAHTWVGLQGVSIQL